MKNLRKILALVLALVFVFAFAACANTASDDNVIEDEADTKEFTLVVEDLDGSRLELTGIEYYEGDILGDVLLKGGYIEGEQGDYGLYVKTVNEVTYDYETDGAYWSIYVNGEASMTGVDSIVIEEGAEYAFVAIKGE